MHNRPRPIAIPSATPKSRDGRLFKAAGNGFEIRSVIGATEIELYDEIGPAGITAKDFRKKLSAARGDIVLRINSPGGNVFDGLAIFNDLLAYKNAISVEVVGLAASAASIIAMAGDQISIAENAFLMIHNAWSVSIGDRNTLVEAARVLQKIDQSMARTYATKSGMPENVISRMMDDETWMTGKEAVDSGFAGQLLPPTETNAKFDISIFAKAPTINCDGPKLAELAARISQQAHLISEATY